MIRAFDENVVVITLDGNIGAGKSTLLAQIRDALPEVEVLLEPVAEWMTMKDADGKSLLELFYTDKKRWSYTFQNTALLTRLRTMRLALATTKKKVIITERSVLTDRYVFADMLRESGDLSSLEWALYLQWYETFAGGLPFGGLILLTTGVATSASRIVTRGRSGEDLIPIEYLAALDAQHHKWARTTELPVLELSTDPGASVEEAIERVRVFVDKVVARHAEKVAAASASSSAAAAPARPAEPSASSLVTPVKAAPAHTSAQTPLSGGGAGGIVVPSAPLSFRHEELMSAEAGGASSPSSNVRRD